MASISNSSKSAAAIAKLQDTQDDISRRTDIELKKLRELSTEEVKLTRELVEMKARMGGCNAQKDSEDAIGKQVKNLEKRLDKSKVKFNDAIAYNKYICDEIETTRYELSMGQDAIKEQQINLAEKRKELRIMAEAMQESYASRDRAHSSVRALKSDAEFEEGNFRQDWDTMKVVLEEDAKRQHDLQRTRLKSGKHTVHKDKSAADVAKLDHKINVGRWAAAETAAGEQLAKERSADIEAAIDRIFKATNIFDVDELVASFQERSEKEMRELLLTQELDDQIRVLVEEITVLRMDIDHSQGRGREAEGERRKMETNLQDRLASIEARIDVTQQELQASEDMEAKIIPRVARLHEMLGGAAPKPPTPEGEEAEAGEFEEKVDIRWMVSTLSQLVEPKITQLCRRMATKRDEDPFEEDEDEPGSPKSPDYKRMVSAAETAAEMPSLWLTADDDDNASETSGAMEPRWNIHIRPPSIRGVVVDSSDEDSDDDDRGASSPAGHGGVLSREEIKQRAVAATPKEKS